MKKALFTLALVLLLTVFTSCKTKRAADTTDQSISYREFVDAGKVIGVQAGEGYAQIASGLFHAKSAPEYHSIADLLAELRLGSIDAVLTSDMVASHLKSGAANTDLIFIPVDKSFFVIQSAPIFYDGALCEIYNEWLPIIKTNGIYQEMMYRWFSSSLPEQMSIPTLYLTNRKGTLLVCDTHDNPPYIYHNALGELTGFDIELVSRFANYLEMDLQVTTLPPEEILPLVASGQADISSSMFDLATEGEAQGVFFGMPTLTNEAVLIVNNKSSWKSNFTAYQGKRLGVILGSLAVETARKIGAEAVFYTHHTTAVDAVKAGEIDGFLDFSRVVVSIADSTKGLQATLLPDEVFNMPITGLSHNQAVMDVVDRFNYFLTVIQDDGTLYKIERRWLGAGEDTMQMPQIDNYGGNGYLRVAVAGAQPPYSFYDDNLQLSGFCVEIALLFGAFEKRIVQFDTFSPEDIVKIIIMKKADLGLLAAPIPAEGYGSEGYGGVSFTHTITEVRYGVLTPENK